MGNSKAKHKYESPKVRRSQVEIDNEIRELKINIEKQRLSKIIDNHNENRFNDKLERMSNDFKNYKYGAIYPEIKVNVYDIIRPRRFFEITHDYIDKSFNSESIICEKMAIIMSKCSDNVLFDENIFKYIIFPQVLTNDLNDLYVFANSLLYYKTTLHVISNLWLERQNTWDTRENLYRIKCYDHNLRKYLRDEIDLQYLCSDVASKIFTFIKSRLKEEDINIFNNELKI